MVPLAVVAFLMVWVCSHAINVLIILSPFSTLDALLKLMRTGLLVAVGLAYLIAPWLAAAFCLVIIAVAAWLAPAALRLAIFGARYAGGHPAARAGPQARHAGATACIHAGPRGGPAAAHRRAGGSVG